MAFNNIYKLVFFIICLLLLLLSLLTKRYEVTREWRKLHNEELNDLYSSPNIVRVSKSRRMRGAEHVTRMGESRCVYKVLVGKPEGNSPLEKKTRFRGKDNIKMDLREVGYGGMD
jgi:hypothetical protein